MSGLGSAPAARRTIDPDWPWQGDDETPARYIAALADALWRHEHIEHWATLGALIVAARAVGGDAECRLDIDTNPAWGTRPEGAPGAGSAGETTP